MSRLEFWFAKSKKAMQQILSGEKARKRRKLSLERAQVINPVKNREFYKRLRDGGRLGKSELEMLGRNTFSYGDTHEVTVEHDKKVNDWLRQFRTQNDNSKRIWEMFNVKHNDIAKNNFIKALYECAVKNEDPKIANLYGAISDIMIYSGIAIGPLKLFGEYTPIREIYTRAENLRQEEIKYERAVDFLDGLHEAMHENGVILEDGKVFDGDIMLVKQSLKNPKTCHDEVYKFLTKCYGKEVADAFLENFVRENYPKNSQKYISFFEAKEHGKTSKIIDAEFLDRLCPDKPEQFLPPINVPADREGVEYSVYEIFTRSQLKKYGNELNNCLGESDVYFNKIRKGETRVFIIRDEDNEPAFAVEYDNNSKAVLQIEGFNNSIPGDETLNNVVRSLRNVGIKVDGLDLTGSIIVFEKDGQYSVLDNEVSSKELSEKIKNDLISALRAGFKGPRNGKVWDLEDGVMNYLAQDEIDVIFNSGIKLGLSLLDDQGVADGLDDISCDLVFQDGHITLSGTFDTKVSFPNLKKINGSLKLGTNFSWGNRYKRTAIFPELEEVTEGITLSYFGNQDLKHMLPKNKEYYIKRHFPKLKNPQDIKFEIASDGEEGFY